MPQIQELLQDPLWVRGGELFLLLLLRILPLVTFTPLLGGSAVPAQMRIGFSAALAGLLTPALLSGFPPSPLGVERMLPLAAKELLVGITLAVLLRMVFEMLAASGAIVDAVRGATMANVIDPTTRQQSSLLAAFFTLFFVTLFVSSGGLELFFLGLGDSLIGYPPWQLMPLGSPASEVVGPGAALSVLGLLVRLFVVALQLAMPVVAVVLLLDVAMGLLNKAAPRIQVFFLSMTLKGALGILILFLTLTLVAELALAETLRWVGQLGSFY